MKKKMTVMFTAILLLVGVLMLVVACTNENIIDSIQNDYKQIQSDISSKKISESEAFHKYSLLMDKIAKGDASQKSAYADTLRQIINNSIEFNDDEVFSVANELSLCYKLLEKGREYLGVQNVWIEKTSDGNAFMFDYADVTSYSIRQMNEDEKEYLSDALVAHDEAFGKYRMEITFHDAEASKTFSQKYSPDTVYELKDVPSALNGKVKIRCTYVGGSSFTVYIGSDEVLNVQENKNIKLNHIVGTESINLK